MDVAPGAFGEYEGRDATGKITLSELSYHSGPPREAAHLRDHAARPGA